MINNKITANNLERIQNIESILTAKCSYTHRMNNNPLCDNIQSKFD